MSARARPRRRHGRRVKTGIEPAFDRPVATGQEDRHDRPRHLLALEGDDPEGRVLRRVLAELGERLVRLVDPAEAVAERLGLGEEDAAQHRRLRDDRPDLEPVGQRNVRDRLEVGSGHLVEAAERLVPGGPDERSRWRDRCRG